MAELLIEIGTEEIPAGYIPPALEAMSRELKAWLEKNRVNHGPVRTLGTPRRLTVAVEDVASRQPDWEEVFQGPSVKVAYDAQGRPTRAAEGFARGKGVAVEQLTVEETAKGPVVCARVQHAGRPVRELLGAYLTDWVAAIPFPKKMRWGVGAEHPVPFARPIHWIAALFDGEPLAFAVDGIRAGTESRGHRFLKPDAFRFATLAEYRARCGEHRVLVDPEERREQIVRGLETLAREVQGQVMADPDLLQIVTYLVEYPVPLRGDIDPHFLQLPVELLEITMKHHQKYFPVWKNATELLPHFITISNMPDSPEGHIIRGNQRVLRARLEDARFFFQEDQKQPLEAYVDRLRGVVFQKNLGTLYEKVERIVALVERLEQTLEPPDRSGTARRAARLCKADLTTQMVFEFPELQGIMGGYYAEKDEGPEVALAIKEHYKPAFAGDGVPTSPAGALVALADKLDTVVGCLSVGLIPTGSEDPYALRRHTMGIIQILIEKDLPFHLDDLIETAIQEVGSKAKLPREEIRNQALDLFRQRFRTLLTQEGFEYDVIDAVLATNIESFKDVLRKAEALSRLKRLDYFESLAIAFRRVVSILEGQSFPEPRPEAFHEAAEKALWEQYLALREPVAAHLARRDYPPALEEIVKIKPQVDAFFDQVMVNVEDPAVRENRKALLYAIAGLFSQIADFSRIVVKKG